jgi:hypothetical protein
VTGRFWPVRDAELGQYAMMLHNNITLTDDPEAANQACVSPRLAEE